MGGRAEERVVPGPGAGAHGRVAHVVWVSVHGDGTGRDEDEPQDGIFEGIGFSPEADLPSVGDRRGWVRDVTVDASTVGAHVLEKVLTKGGNVHKLVVVVGASWCGINRVRRRLDVEQG